jgi:transcriptional regulator with XRE-family HTH domain
MRLDELRTDEAVLREIGARLEQLRLARNRSQLQMAQDAGVGRATIQRIERGESVQLTSLVKLLRALGLLGELEAAIPAAVESPIAELERRNRPSRRRASSRRTASPSARADRPWRWGDEGPPRG